MWTQTQDLNAITALVRGKVGSSRRLPYWVCPRTEAVELANQISTDDIPLFGNDDRDGLSPLDALLTLQEAIDRCKNDIGDRIIVMRGTHSLTTPVLFNKRGIIVEGVDFGMPSYMQGERFMLYGPADAPAAIISRACKIRNLGFAGQWIGAASHNLQVDPTGGGFNGGFTSIKGCRFATWGVSPDYAILLKGMIGGEISQNKIDGVFDKYNVGGIGLSDTGGIQVAGVRFRDNIFSNLGETSYAFVHLAGRFPQNNIIQSNVLSGNATDVAGAPGRGKFLDNNGCTNYDTFLCDNWIGLATNTGSYDDTVATLQGLGIRFAGNHYSE